MQTEYSQRLHFDIHLCIQLIIVYNTIKTTGKHPSIILMFNGLLIIACCTQVQSQVHFSVWNGTNMMYHKGILRCLVHL